jgi:hypothetical protein
VPSVNARNAEIVTWAGRRICLELEGIASAWSCEKAPFSPAFNSREMACRLIARGEVGLSVNSQIATTRIRLPHGITNLGRAEPEAIHAY